MFELDGQGALVAAVVGFFVLVWMLLGALLGVLF